MRGGEEFLTPVLIQMKEYCSLVDVSDIPKEALTWTKGLYVLDYNVKRKIGLYKEMS